jgi:hypothetical protein
MDEAIIACRAVHFVSVMLVFGGAAFRLYAVESPDLGVIAVLDARLRALLLVSAVVALLSALALVPSVASRMAGSSAAALDWKTIVNAGEKMHQRAGVKLHQDGMPKAPTGGLLVSDKQDEKRNCLARECYRVVGP